MINGSYNLYLDGQLVAKSKNIITTDINVLAMLMKLKTPIWIVNIWEA